MVGNGPGHTLSAPKITGDPNAGKLTVRKTECYKIRHHQEVFKLVRKQEFEVAGQLGLGGTQIVLSQLPPALFPGDAPANLWAREKLEEDPKNPTLIQTVWRVGYKFGGTKE